ncbi:MAG: EAL domain-containing protein [Marinagarivorans sp.]|nr:EAL domain-containing protein [Marinagarivorans sp.]
MSGDDLMMFTDEVDDASCANDAQWNILIVDDDAQVHAATKFALKGTEILHHTINFIDAYSAREAKELLQTTKDIAVILLDVVMETPNAGLDLIAYIRGDLGLDNVRIVLRTGEPNQAPEMAVIRDYDINDYKIKSEITQKSLYACLTSAVRCYEQIKTIKEGKETLNDVLTMGRALLTCDSENAFHDAVFRHACKMTHQPDGAMLIVNKGNGVEIIHAQGIYAESKGLLLSALDDAGVKAQLENAMPLKRNVITHDAMVLYLGSVTRGERYCYIYGDKKRNEVTDDMMAIFARNCAISGDNILFVERLKNHAYTDALTGLPNRNALEKEITEQQEKSDSSLMLAIIDIDGFAELNASLGQRYADLLLQVSAERLKNRFRGACFLARISSNAFAILGPESRVTKANLLAPFSDPFEIAGEPQLLNVTAVMAPMNENSAAGSDVIKDVSIVLKQAKKTHRGNVLMFDRAVVDGARHRLEMLKKLREAFDNNELFLVFQPKLSLESERVVGMEALLRWRTRHGEFIPPDQFIPLAEQSGLIIRMGEWVLRSAIQQLVNLRQQGYSDVHMAVNLSVAQLQHPDMLKMLGEVMGEFHQISPAHIELEITESIAMGDIVGNIATLNRIKSMGFKLAMDDFGTGFSSLNYLQQMPIDCLKIDRAFVNTSNTASGYEIIEMIVQLAKTLGLKVVAEGVETLEQANLLKNLNCDEVQGFYFAKPMPEADLNIWLAARQ